MHGSLLVVQQEARNKERHSFLVDDLFFNYFTLNDSKTNRGKKKRELI